MPPVEPNDEQQETNDAATPFQPASDASAAPAADDTHPATDTDVDKDDLYQNGVAEASGTPAPAEPNSDPVATPEVNDAAAAEDADLAPAENAGEADDNQSVEDKSL